MADYFDWNNTLVWYFTHQIPSGSGIFLSVDESELNLIAQHLKSIGEHPLEDPVSDFQAAVRDQCVRTGNGRTSVYLNDLAGPPNAEGPMGVGFLAAMVLAASYMGDDDDQSSNNYFSRLRQILGIIDGENGRPNGMTPALSTEVPLWNQWNRWIQEQGFLSTTVTGTGATEYINIPISQSLLRKSDRDRLKQLFDDRKWSQDRDKDTLYHQIARESWQWTKHLRELIDDPGLRYEPLQDEIFDTWQEWKIFGFTPRTAGERSRESNISLKLYRTEDPLEGINYYFYPETTFKRQGIQEINVNINGMQTTLRQGRPGRYLPLEVPVSSQMLDEGCEFPTDGHMPIKSIKHIPRKFWILVSDPEDPDSGVRASWGPPSFGEPFVLLFHASIESDVTSLRKEHMIDWQSELKVVESLPDWVEITDCSVISTLGWRGIFPVRHRELLSALAPNTKVSIGVAKGLRLPNNGSWLADYGPQITVTTPFPDVSLSVKDVRNDIIVWEFDAQNIGNEEILDIQWPKYGPGLYQVVASVRGSQAQRMIRLADWSELEPSPLAGTVTIPISDVVEVSGSILIDSTGESK